MLGVAIFSRTLGERYKVQFDYMPVHGIVLIDERTLTSNVCTVMVLAIAIGFQRDETPVRLTERTIIEPIESRRWTKPREEVHPDESFPKFQM